MMDHRLPHLLAAGSPHDVRFRQNWHGSRRHESGQIASPYADAARRGAAWGRRAGWGFLEMEAEEYALMDAVEDRMWWYRALHAMVLRALEREAAPPGLPLLDAGCGTGGLLRRIAAAMADGRLTPRRLIGFDISPLAVDRARAKVPEAAISVASVNDLPFADASFGVAVSCDVLSHQAVDEARALAEFRRVLAPGSVLVLNLPAHQWLYAAHDRRVHTRERYDRTLVRERLGRAGFAVVEALYWNSLLFPLMVLQRKLLSRAETDDEARSDVQPYPAPVEAAFGAVTAAERALIGAGVRFPIGGSIVAVAVKS
jgi:ubiquinone/menaquinone biosynthesis C-methylase UbiE